MKFALRNLIAFHIFAIATYLTWAHGGTRVEYLVCVPWLLFLLLSALIGAPPQRPDELLSDTRRRVWGRILGDPLFYLGVTMAALLVVQWLNGGRELVNDPATGKTSMGPPPVPWPPFSVEPSAAWQQLWWFAAAFGVAVAARHGVSRSGRRRLLLWLCWGGAATALFGWIQVWSGTRSLFWITPLEGHFFGSFGYENHAGAFFTLLFAVSGGLWFQTAMDKNAPRHSWVLLIPVALNFSGVFGSLSRAAMLLSLALLAGGGVAAVAAAWSRLLIGGRVRVVACAVMTAVLLTGFYLGMPEGRVQRELQTLHVQKLYDDTIGQRLYQYGSSWAMTADYPFCGVGGWGYRHFVQFYVTPEELTVMAGQKGTANVHNDLLQFLAEHGLIGLSLLLGAVAVLLIPILRGIWTVWTTPPVVDWDNPYVPPLLRVPAVVYAVLLGTAATVIHSMIDLPFRSPAILVTWTLCLACAPAFLPRAVPREVEKK